jgi:hypothetical protein
MRLLCLPRKLVALSIQQSQQLYLLRLSQPVLSSEKRGLCPLFYIMTFVYTRIDGKLAAFKVDTDDVIAARNLVQGEMSVKHREPVLALYSSPSPKKQRKKRE